MFHRSAWAIAASFLAGLSLLGADSPAPVPVSEVVSRISLPEGFHATLFAGEPDVVQPIAMATDSRGRLWVVECLSYPDWSTNKLGEDRVVIFEDRDGDGRFDKKTVFWDQGRNLTSIAVGLGGVWLCSLPELIFIPDRDRDDRPDSDPEVMLDGWDMGSSHNAFNGLNWGPDGWLYGCNGILGNSLVGVPGTRREDRVAINCGVWRFHPSSKTFEAVAHGTTNPWGIAFNEFGQAFVANCVIKHLFHIVPGGRYERMFGQDFNPYAFQLIPSIADHIHWAGGYWKTEGAENPQNDTTGGGHAHSGAMIYLGGNWPAKYHGTFFTVNIHGHRVNNDALVPNGSGYTGTHNKDFLRVDDSWFRGVAVVPSHDGGMYVADWSDAGECHDYEDIHRDNGRILKISYGTARTPNLDLSKAQDRDLLANLADDNEWAATQARLLLQERALRGKLNASTHLELIRLLRDGRVKERLRALWTFHASFGLTEPQIQRLLFDPEPWIRAWTVQLATEKISSPADFAARLTQVARVESSPHVRLYLASALQRLPVEHRGALAAALARRAEDTPDPNIPLILWYGIEPIASTDEAGALRVLENAGIPLIRQFIAQRLALRSALDEVSNLLLGTRNVQLQADIVRGLFAALNGRRQLDAPPAWESVARKLERHPDAQVRNEALRLSVIFGDHTALADLIRRASDKDLSPAERVQALEGLIATQRKDVLPLLLSVVKDPAVRLSALKGLSAYDDPDVPKLVLSQYSTYSVEEKAAAIESLSSRAAYARELLSSLANGTIPAADVTPFTLRQIQTYKDPEVQKLLKDVGSVRPITGDKAAEIEKYRKILQPGALEKANLSRGRELFVKTCAGCHVLFDEGNQLAPELTGSQRTNLDYILENVVDPNAVVWDQYKATYFELNDDRLLSGVIVRENESTVTIQSPVGMVTVPRDEIASRTRSQLSLMPEGLFESLSEQEIVDLVGYLQSPEQVPLPAE